jgi:dipeptidyl aminopeptidase/acylaminoacyl peptidase
MKHASSVLASLLVITSLFAQERTDPPAASRSFKWVNEVPKDIQADPVLIHGKFFSQANKNDVGYFIALPRRYDAPDAKGRRFPVIYYLHGGIQGSEGRAVQGYPRLSPMLTSENYPAAFMVMVNGGKPNYIDTADSKGETALIELIEHVDKTYRTVAAPAGRVVLGHSMGGRATGRIIFKRPDLIGTGVAMAGGYQREKTLSESGAASDGEFKVSDPTNNAFDNASVYAKRTGAPKVRLMVVIGNQDSNYVANLEWCAHLARLKIAHELIVVPGTGHFIDQKIQNTDRRVFDFIADSLNRSSNK